MLTRLALQRAILIGIGVRFRDLQDDRPPLHIRLHPYTWEEVEIDAGSPDIPVDCREFRGIPAMRTTLLCRGVVIARWPDGSENLLDLEGARA